MKDLPIPNIRKQIFYEVPEHQILLSFSGDDDAAKFYEWWWEQGEKLFIAFCEKEIR